MTLGPADRDSDIVSHHLGAHHRQGLGLRRVDLARHDARPRLVGGQGQLTDATAGTTAHHADVVGNLVAADGQLLEGTVGLDHRVVGGQCLELVGGGDEGVARGGGHVGGHGFGIAVRRVQPRADRRSAEGEFGEVTERGPQSPEAMVQLGDITAELLPEGQGGRIHQVGPSNLDHLRHLFRLGCQGIAELLHARNRRADDAVIGGDVHRRGEGVVGTLRLVGVIVGVDRSVALAEGSAGQHVRPVGDDLVHVHVGLRARACLPDHEREAVVQLAGDDLPAHADDQVPLGLGQDARFTIGFGRGHLQVAEGVDHLDGHAAHGADGEVVAAALRLGAPVLVGGHGHFAERVLFDPGVHGAMGVHASLADFSAAACMRLALSMASMSPLRTASVLDVS